MKRRDIIKGIAMLPLAAGVASRANPVSAGRVAGGTKFLPGALTPGPQIYQSIGVEPVINCRGTFTIIGASVELPEVRQAMESACQYFVQLDELAMGVGKRLAEITGADWGMVSAGCAAGIKHVTVGCVTGGNPEKLIRIPNLEGFEKTEVIIPRSSRNVYDHSIRNAGVKIIMIETLEELKSAISPRTAMIYFNSEARGTLSLEDIAAVAKPKKVPILVDAAAEILTVPNVYLAKGATVVAYSGGKAIRGPQCAGLLLGDKNVLMAAWQASAPHHGPGRDNKLGREEHIGMLAAVEAWGKRDHDKEMKLWNSYLESIASKVSGIESVKTTIKQPEGLGNRTPTLSIQWDPLKLHVTGQEVANELSTTKPRIALSTGGGAAVRTQATDPPVAPTTSLSLASWMMQPGDDKIVAGRIFEVLSRKRNPKPQEPNTSVTDISGRWDLVVDFFTSQGQHQLFIEKQDGKWLEGSHKGDFSVMAMAGTIEGEQVKLRSQYSVPGDSIVYTFNGTVNGDTMTGKIHMGEYLTSNFSAKKYLYKNPRVPVNIPVGPPLSS